MTYEELKEEIAEIAKVAKSVPEPFQEKCFAILLSHLLAPRLRPNQPGEAQTHHGGEAGEVSGVRSLRQASIALPAAVKAFMQKTGITEGELTKVVYYEDGEFHFQAEPSTKKINRGVIEWALLLALRSAITRGSFEVDPEDIRSMCQEKGYYDSTNFWKAFKSAKTAGFFNGELTAQGDARKLTALGQEELANAIRALAG